MLLEKKWILKFCFRLYKIEKVELVWPLVKDRPRKAPSKNFGMVPTWKTKKEKTPKFVDKIGYNRNERGRGIGDLELVDREGWRKKINLI
jgi:hypothetical protein